VETPSRHTIQRSSNVAVKLRLVRIGKKKQPTYRVVAADSRSPRNGRFIEIVGTYAPRGTSSAEPEAVIDIDQTKVAKWLSQGAKPTERVGKLLAKGQAAPSASAAPRASTGSKEAAAAPSEPATSTEPAAATEPAAETDPATVSAEQ
jgi:small subunit ribosomal protein S16